MAIKDNRYHEASEAVDDVLFNRFIMRTMIFNKATRAKTFSHVDYICEDIKGRTCYVELKRRNFSSTAHDAIFIEPEKFFTLVNRASQWDGIPLYLNFMEDGVLMFDLRKFNPVEVELARTRIRNNGYHGVEQDVWRMKLPTKDAIMYKRFDNGDYIRDNGKID